MHPLQLSHCPRVIVSTMFGQDARREEGHCRCTRSVKADLEKAMKGHNLDKIKREKGIFGIIVAWLLAIACLGMGDCLSDKFH